MYDERGVFVGSPMEMPRIAHEFAIQAAGGTVPPAWPTVAAGRLVVPAFNDGTIENLSLRIYLGPALDLRVDPYLMRFNGRRQNLIEYVTGGKQFLDGDDDRYSFNVSIPIRRNELIVCDYWNLDLVNPYDFRLTVEIDYAGGVWRWPVSTGGGR
jgi:hypothetical protein